MSTVEPDAGEVLGFLQLCADRRFHRAVMAAFEAETGLRHDEYWIEATAGGAPAFDAVTPTARFAYDNGARIFGWAAHGDACGGFPGAENAAIEEKLGVAAAARAKDLPGAEHRVLFATGDGIAVSQPG